MRRTVLAVIASLAFVALTAPAGAQQDEDESGELDPSDLAATTTTTLLDEPVAPGEEVIPPAPDAGVTTVATTIDPTATTSTTLPEGCEPPRPPQATFTGAPVANDARTARFTVGQLLSGSLDGYQVGSLVDVDFYDDTRFLEIGTTYLVAVEINPDDGRLRSKVKPIAALFGGDQVIGVDDPNVVCPALDDLVITRLPDGTSVETGLLAPLLEEPSDLLWAFVRPALAVLGVLVALVVVKRALWWITRTVIRLIRRDQAVRA